MNVDQCCIWYLEGITTPNAKNYRVDSREIVTNMMVRIMRLIAELMSFSAMELFKFRSGSHCD
jgi:hypothetical protein